MRAHTADNNNNRDEHPSPGGSVQHGRVLTLMFFPDAPQLWQVVLRADVIFGCRRYSKPSLTRWG